ncbi:MAG: 2-dehydro-3-deoxygalactonokinase [Bacteroidetes bacterium]|nr:2-dehydro-3-deoxygalactonokinase [Bacteroidota bacterium]
MEKFLSCDWGTSSFRLKLIDINNLIIIDSVNAANGIAAIHDSWKKDSHDNRILFYRDYISSQIRVMEQKSGVSLKNIPIILSGMASSNIGMIELPYKKLPFDIDGSDLVTENIPADKDFPHDILIISGACTNVDVMRGEETQLVGATNGNNKSIYIFPGTHSKHVFVEDKRAVDFKTYMTGEFFELLSGKSILVGSVEQVGDLTERNNATAFGNGVLDGLRLNLLHSSFRVRTNSLFNKISKQENYYYLSGLLIGSELKDLQNTEMLNITVVANRTQAKFYEEAFVVLNDNLNRPILSFIDAEAATIKGQIKISNGKR